MPWKTTVIHDEIRDWVTKNNGTPAVYRDADMPGAVGVLRIKFGDEQSFTQIGWQEFFDRFESDKLAFHFRDDVTKGEEELSFNFLNRNVYEEVHDDMTQLPEDNEIAKENMFPTQSDI